MSTILAKLPTEMRDELKDSLGPIYTDTEEMLSDVGEPVVTVGDIVTYHLLEADFRPDVAVVDGKTKRERVERDVLGSIEAFDERIDVANPQSTITDELLDALATALENTEPTVIVVDGEEDLVTLPAVIAVPEDGSVVYGQPDAGMVLITVDTERKRHCQDLIERMQSDYDRIEGILL
jgi:uncharacterized protein (UPF0218 family)